MLDKDAITEILTSSKDFIRYIELDGPDGSIDRRKLKKIGEVVGFAEQILKATDTLLKGDNTVFLECSCGKSYLSFVLNHIISNTYKTRAFFLGVDINKSLVEKCERIRAALGYENMQFVHGRTIDFQPDRLVPEGSYQGKVDVVIALHACDTATDEAIAKGIKLGAKYVMVVPCCQNQIRSQLRFSHPLISLTEFGVLRYKFADILTEALRSQFLVGAGYHVELMEVVSPKLSPKNILISARKTKGRGKRGMKPYLELSKIFKTHFKLQDFFPELSRELN
ncbi:MAG TPA: SAM-dependent methyltransferase [Candidatus Brocadiales bacterium]|nr:SAM-dependent methyltransferase [Candidatus Brocadiales bacterium]